MAHLLKSGLALATLFLAVSCSTKDSAPAPTPTQEIATTQSSKATAGRAISNFVQLPGGGWVDVGVGGTGSNQKVYASTAANPDLAIENLYVFNNDFINPQWTKVNGVYNVDRVTVDKDGNPWVTTSSGTIHRYEPFTNSWRQLPGQAKDIGAGGGNNGLGEIYIIGYGSGNRDIYSYNHSANVWYSRGIGKGVSIDVSDNGLAWLLTDNGEVYNGNVGGWSRQSGQLKDIGATGSSAYGTTPAVYGIGYGSSNRSIYENVGGNWVKTPTGEAIRVDVDQNGRPWVINLSGNIYYSN